MSKSTVQVFERLFLVAGVVLLVATGLALIDRSYSSRRALAVFDQARASAPAR